MIIAGTESGAGLVEGMAGEHEKHPAPGPALISTELLTPIHFSRILVAADGGTAANAALKIAGALAARDEASVNIVVVWPAPPMAVPGLGIPNEAWERDSVAVREVMEGVRRQARRVGGNDWQVDLEIGRPGPTIAAVADAQNADLIILGLERHRAIARLFGAETALRVLRHTDRPVLGVSVRARKLPRRAVIGVDFGPSSLRSIRYALSMMGHPAKVRLVHVRSQYELGAVDPEARDRIYTAGIAEAFVELTEKLAEFEGITVETEIASGIPAEVLLEHARQEGTDLIAVGSHSYPLVDRVLIGSSATALMRAAQTSVLVTPPAAEPVESTSPGVERKY